MNFTTVVASQPVRYLPNRTDNWSTLNDQDIRCYLTPKRINQFQNSNLLILTSVPGSSDSKNDIQ